MMVYRSESLLNFMVISMLAMIVFDGVLNWGYWALMISYLVVSVMACLWDRDRQSVADMRSINSK